MNPRLASILTWAVVFYLFRRDVAEKLNVSRALWIPTTWLLIISTRAVTTWLSMFGISAGGTSVEEGSSLDATVYFVLIAAGLRVLIRRHVQLGTVIRNNPWFAIYLAYCLVAVLWSDLPFVSFKRWAKNLGHPIMILILLTERDPVAAFTCLLKRCAYVVVPVSILFIKYYPEWGRGFNQWNGQAYNTGITEGKNALGYDCLILGFFFIWHLFNTYRREKGKPRRNELILCLGFVGMITWLFSIADSKTPLISLLVGIAIFLATTIKWVNRRYILAYIVVGVGMLFVLEEVIGIYEPALELLGRNASLTERTPLWEELSKWGARNPILGTGFESFWLGERRETIWEIMKWNASQAHNGYLETYLNIGSVGLFFLICLLLHIVAKARSALVAQPTFGRFRFAFFFSILIYNWTEAGYGGLHPLFFVLYAIGLDHPMTTVAEAPRASAETLPFDAAPASMTNFEAHPS